MKKQLLALALIGGLMTAHGCADTKKKNTAEETETAETEIQKEEVIEVQTPNIVGVAAGNENFSTLVAAVKAAGLVETLSGEGPFTVFAPVNTAFEKLPEGTLDGLLKPESKATLTSILTYHVVSGNVKAADVVKAIQDNNGSFAITTVQGNTLTASLDGENVILTDAKGGTSTIVLTDVEASNGVIHAIDTVVMP
ncbi:fasciclin domain-containing protein [Croceitalea rosinachiae]|uniref:Fasciclin domain-containing protein n=1 Tax=Croceitalea rosinachiae TaxID=3075596 RepID=A0ABU3A8P7_9FLAO|nr:fasciclin domain-containing protein [Croceitalea sp. F388]MDT0606329.1 fasciclin domain-containing protein [Croceitalea sp. F388]